LGNRLKLAARLSALMLALGGVSLLGACSDESDAGPSREENTLAAHTPGLTPEVTDDGRVRVEGLRGERYCEVLLARVVDGPRLNAEVWNTYGLNDCPPEEWEALDADAIKTEREVLAAILNGPRYWMMDAIERTPDAVERQETTFGTLRMFLAATVDLGPIPPNLAPYTEREVARAAIFEFSAGAEIYELTDPAGRVFVMQSYSQQRAPDLAESALADLGARITPPAGWTYAARTLDTTLRVGDGSPVSTVVQDDLGNTYSLSARGPD
jgi:hypothetical protein